MDDFCIRLNIRICHRPDSLSERRSNRESIEIALNLAKKLYSDYEIRLELATPISELDVDNRINSFYVRSCNNGSFTDDQRTLFSMRDGVGDDEIFAYFVEVIMWDHDPPTIEGCSAHPIGLPALVFSPTGVFKSTKWTLAHEIGHLVGLDHRDKKRELMHHDMRLIPRVGGFIPRLTDDDLLKIRKSAKLVHPCL